MEVYHGAVRLHGGDGQDELPTYHDGYGILAWLGDDGVPETAVIYNPYWSGHRRLLRYTHLEAQRLA